MSVMAMLTVLQMVLCGTILYCAYSDRRSPFILGPRFYAISGVSMLLWVLALIRIGVTPELGFLLGSCQLGYAGLLGYCRSWYDELNLTEA